MAAWGRYAGPQMTYLSLGNIPYDHGMMQFKNNIPKNIDYDTILLIDNDCFVSDIGQTQRFIRDFQDKGYDFSCHLVAERMYEGYDFQTSSIQPVINQHFDTVAEEPKFIPRPHWENAYLLFSRTMWEKLTADDLSHSRKMIKSVFDHGGKMGVHEAKYRGVWSHYEKGWFHVGNLMAFYYKIAQEQDLSSLAKDELARVGYFYAQRDLYGKQIYPPKVQSFLGAQSKTLVENAREAWYELTVGTCMENWTP